jgi:YD repeat-containing protein
MTHTSFASFALLILTGSVAIGDSNFYDNSGRLIRTVHPEGTATLYTYDEADNLLSVSSTAVPKAPDDLTATRASETSAQISWTDRSTTENGFRLERRLAGGYEWVLAAALPADTTNYEDTGLDPSQNYVYRIYALGTPPLTSAYSAEAAAGGEGSEDFSIRSFTRTGAVLELRFDTAADQRYALETTPTLQNPTWTTLDFATTPAGPATNSSLTGTGSPAVVYFAPNGDKRFYRVVKAP